MIRSALIALGLSAGAAQGQGLVPIAPMLETCGGTRLILAVPPIAPGETRANDLEVSAGAVIDGRLAAYFDEDNGSLFEPRFSYVDIQYSFTDNRDRKLTVSLPGSLARNAQAIEPLFERVDVGFYDVEGRFTQGDDVDLEAGQIALTDALDPVYGYILNADPVLNGFDLDSAEATFDQNGQPAIGFRFRPQGVSAFAQYTSDNIGEPFAIVMRGQVMSAPTIQSPILGGSGLITGGFTLDEAVELAAVLTGGVLPFDLSVVGEETVDGSNPSADFCP